MNHDPNKIMNGMQEKNRLLTAKNDEYIKLSEKFASAKRDYNVAYASKVTELKIAGTPITIIKDLVKGDKTVAEMGYEMDIADGVLKACRESMADIRVAIDAYRSLLSWLKTELERT